MSKLVLDMSLTPEGSGAGPTPSEEDPTGAGGERFRAAWSPATLARLASVKRCYDPTTSLA